MIASRTGDAFLAYFLSLGQEVGRRLRRRNRSARQGQRAMYALKAPKPFPLPRLAHNPALALFQSIGAVRVRAGSQLRPRHRASQPGALRRSAADCRPVVAGAPRSGGFRHAAGAAAL
ncbi:hypothetical protein CBM2589_B280088 [Cupriavidus taiwanensis]|uniref:Uncharacterized protein n=1 Tax=Cupriavidus taiwanensis TaxID=164546 RepID=A0A375BTY0_9BURK|nr:hypothetical protein CBM2589_B280088 [Cupriavidus taiwanensis]